MWRSLFYKDIAKYNRKPIDLVSRQRDKLYTRNKCN